MSESLGARILSSCPPDIKAILGAAWSHDLQALKPLLDEPGKANVQEPTTKETPLHAAIRSCGPLSSSPLSLKQAQTIKDGEEQIERAKAIVAELFQWGGIWNDVDDRNETPGCVALRLCRRELYDMCVAAGMRAEMLFSVLDGYEELGSDDAENEEDMEDGAGGDGDGRTEETRNGTTGEIAEEEPNREIDKDIEDFENALAAIAAQAHASADPAAVAPPNKNTVTSDAYLASNLTYDPKKLVDDAGNTVMMTWETDIMKRSVESLLSETPPTLAGTSSCSDATAVIGPAPWLSPEAINNSISSLPCGKRILNIGFGMGIIDSLFAGTKPSKHHIIEAHSSVLRYINKSPDSNFGAEWVAAAKEPGANKVWEGRWQEICPRLLADGQVYDAIYFDTFGEDYSQLKLFFTDYVPGLLDQDGRFSFFNGLGADRQVCYDVYQKVVEMHLSDAGLDVEWEHIPVDMKYMDQEGKGEFEGVLRRYWTLSSKQNSSTHTQSPSATRASTICFSLAFFYGDSSTDFFFNAIIFRIQSSEMHFYGLAGCVGLCSNEDGSALCEIF